MRCRRRITLDRAAGAIQVSDEAHGAGRHAVVSLLHLAPGCEVTADGATRVLVRVPTMMLRVEFSGAEAVGIEPGFVSSQYGVRAAAPVVRASINSELPIRIGYRIVRA
jgi:hypothetical protein